MPRSPEEKRKRQLQKAKESQERQRQKQRAKLNDPVYQEKLRAKQRAAQERAAQRARERHQEKLANGVNTLSKKGSKQKKASKGLKGRSITAAEKRYQDLIGQLPCKACQKQGRTNSVTSLHHVHGRTKPWAHAMVLPLCAHHHDTPLEKELRDRYPNVYPVHAKGSYGGKSAFEKEYGAQDDLLVEVYESIGEEIPWC
ncbi:Ref family recombination enhancement nuclease [Pseudoalteromonas ruthenica]|uniref:Ref family recombination enhancement nuclease n=1 Tax=Pseudoalteromonas ruthenica TaxID=151081 RepID=UPI00110BEB22|nr:Ref family recombination enhancement nuclease [Pseudoalteromonas ruthenica]TMO87719.1 hypothetical protein CWC12_10600 [Pseudoalteromonas ruthenica]TMP21524.1 hypothetical protein CWC06_18425 [Pseudoalteromonas ruthenica]